MSEESKFDAWSARLTRSRDIFLVGFGGIYALGYLGRALHAWDYNLGVLPGAELQYFIAGLALVTPPALLVAIVYGIWRSLRFLVRWEEAKLRLGSRAVRNRRASYVNWTVGTTAGLGVLLVFLGNTPWLTRVTPDLAHIGSRIGVVGFFLAFFCWIGIVVLREDDPNASSGAEVDKSGGMNVFLRVLEWTGTFLAGLAILLLPGLMILILFVLTLLVGSFGVLPVLPQELGGGAPHCARFDLDPAKLAPEMAAVLLDGPVSTRSAGSLVVRSRPVDVYYSSGDTLLFKVPGDRALRATYELKRMSISGVVWCVRDDRSHR